MKCNNCQKEIEQGVSFCPYCGAKSDEQIPPQNSGIKELLLKQNGALFLTLCILMSVSAGIGIISGNLPVFEILFTIFFWIIFSRSRSGEVDVKSMRVISGIVYAQYIVNWVVAGILGVCAIICAAFFSYVNIDKILSVLPKSELDTSYKKFFEIVSPDFIGIVCALILIVGVALLIVVNVFGTKQIHTFVKSLYMSAASERNEILKANAAKNWLLVKGILKGVGALFLLASASQFISSASYAAAYIIGYVIVKNMFSSEEAF